PAPAATAPPPRCPGGRRLGTRPPDTPGLVDQRPGEHLSRLPGRPPWEAAPSSRPPHPEGHRAHCDVAADRTQVARAGGAGPARSAPRRSPLWEPGPGRTPPTPGAHPPAPAGGRGRGAAPHVAPAPAPAAPPAGP